MNGFKVSKRISTGEIYDLWQGFHVASHIEVYVLIVYKKRVGDAIDYDRIAKLAERVGEVNHYHILKYHKIVQNDMQIGIIMENPQGYTLRQYLLENPQKRVSEPEARYLFKQLVSAVEYLHSLGITFRNLNLDNIYITAGKVVKLGDFLLSPRVGSLYQPAPQLQKAIYSFFAPEMFHDLDVQQQQQQQQNPHSPPNATAQGGTHTMASDLWSLGVVLYVMVCGCYPFEGKNEFDMFLQVRRRRYVLPSYLSDECAAFLRSLLQVNPTDRPSIAALRNHLWILGSAHHPTSSGLATPVASPVPASPVASPLPTGATPYIRGQLGKIPETEQEHTRTPNGSFALSTDFGNMHLATPPNSAYFSPSLPANDVVSSPYDMSFQADMNAFEMAISTGDLSILGITDDIYGSNPLTSSSTSTITTSQQPPEIPNRIQRKRSVDDYSSTRPTPEVLSNIRSPVTTTTTSPNDFSRVSTTTTNSHQVHAPKRRYSSGNVFLEPAVIEGLSGTLNPTIPHSSSTNNSATNGNPQQQQQQSSSMKGSPDQQQRSTHTPHPSSGAAPVAPSGMAAAPMHHHHAIKATLSSNNHSNNSSNNGGQPQQPVGGYPPTAAPSSSINHGATFPPRNRVATFPNPNLPHGFAEQIGQPISTHHHHPSSSSSSGDTNHQYQHHHPSSSSSQQQQQQQHPMGDMVQQRFYEHLWRMQHLNKDSQEQPIRMQRLVESANNNYINNPHLAGSNPHLMGMSSSSQQQHGMGPIAPHQFPHSQQAQHQWMRRSTSGEMNSPSSPQQQQHQQQSSSYMPHAGIPNSPQQQQHQQQQQNQQPPQQQSQSSEPSNNNDVHSDTFDYASLGEWESFDTNLDPSKWVESVILQ